MNINITKTSNFRETVYGHRVHRQLSVVVLDILKRTRWPEDFWQLGALLERQDLRGRK